MTGNIRKDVWMTKATVKPDAFRKYLGIKSAKSFHKKNYLRSEKADPSEPSQIEP